MSEGREPAPRDRTSGEVERPVVPYPSGVRPGEREPLTRRQNWLVWLFFLPPLAWLAWLIVRSIMAK